MRLSPLALPAVLCALLLGACSSGEPSSEASRDSGGSDSSGRPSASPSDQPSSGGASRAGVCRKVRAGIDAFNAGDLQDTVVEFKEAVPLAARAQQQDPSRESRLLLRAVRYYAALPAADYPQAAGSSLEFARWKAVTLSLCVSGQDQLSPGPSPEDSGIPA